MKTLIPLTALAMLVATSATHAQTPAYSKPSGYTTQVLKPGRLNYVGINVLTPARASGTLTSYFNSGLTLVDNKANFTSALQSGKMHTIEITSGAAVGAVREFSTWTSQRINITLAIPGIKIGDKYVIRKNLTLQEMFPNGQPLTGGAEVPSDYVRVPNGSGGFDQYFYKTTSTNGAIGWWTTPDGTTRGTRVTTDIPLLYTDGIQVRRVDGVNKRLVLTGQVKTTSSRSYLVTGDNPLSINPPIGATLLNAGLEKGMQGHATSPSTADLLFVPQAGGTFKRYWRKTSNTGGSVGWYETPNGSLVGTRISAPGSIKLPPYCMIKRKGAAKFVEIKVPSNYSNL